MDIFNHKKKWNVSYRVYHYLTVTMNHGYTKTLTKFEINRNEVKNNKIIRN